MTDKMRDEFESRFKGMDFTRSASHPHYYESPWANGAWNGWKASRESLVIELPRGDSLARRMYGPGSCGANPLISRADAIESIEAAGLKVKS